MASFYKRGEGQWEARIRRKGYPKQQQTWPTRVLAERWARQVEEQMDAGTFVETKEVRQMPLHDLIVLTKDKVFSELEDCIEKCRIADEFDAKFGKWGVLNLTPKDIELWKDELRKSGRKGHRGASTVNHYLNTGSAIYKAGMKRFHLPIPHNPFRLVERLPEPPPRRQQFKDDVVEMLIAANKASNAVRKEKGGREPFGEFEWFLRLALEGAMRRGEIARLAIPHIDLKERTAHLPKTKNKTPRTVPLSGKAVEILRELVSLRTEHPLPDGKLFRLTVDGFKSAYRRARDIVGRTRPDVKGIRFHDSRRTATTKLAKKLDIVELSATTGIKTLRILQTYYQPDPAEMAKKLA